MRGNRKKRIFTIVLALFLLAIVCVAAFTSIGYMLTIPYRGFSQVQERVYIDKEYQGNDAEVLSILHAANERLMRFWGEIKSQPTIIISDSQKKLARLGWTGSPAVTTTFVLGGAHSYIIVSPGGLNVDVAAHELTHAELHERLYAGILFPKRLIPVWFDEGVATQNDYREKYNYDAWLRITENGQKIPDFNMLETAKEFYPPDVETRQSNYIVSKHQVRAWIELHGMEKLLALISDVNAGKSFNDLYYTE